MWYYSMDLWFNTFNLPQYQYTIVNGTPTNPNKASVIARFLTTSLTYLNMPDDFFLVIVTITIKFPKMVPIPIKTHMTMFTRNITYDAGISLFVIFVVIFVSFKFSIIVNSLYNCICDQDSFKNGSDAYSPW